MSRDAGITWEDVADYVGALGQDIAWSLMRSLRCVWSVLLMQRRLAKFWWQSTASLSALFPVCCTRLSLHHSPPTGIYEFGSAPLLFSAPDSMCILVSLPSFVPTGIYEFGNHGGLVVMAPHKAEGPTGALRVSPE